MYRKLYRNFYPFDKSLLLEEEDIVKLISTIKIVTSEIKIKNQERIFDHARHGSNWVPIIKFKYSDYDDMEIKYMISKLNDRKLFLLSKEDIEYIDACLYWHRFIIPFDLLPFHIDHKKFKIEYISI